MQIIIQLFVLEYRWDDIGEGSSHLGRPESATVVGILHIQLGNSDGPWTGSASQIA